ncbi:MAG: hydrogenase [Deltaproteobacteria bacterium RIFOXYA12_FULL_58_15]|nr:MAG: hydrogenase [Deltaproteobacteria bacterium RIFOXYA12_FULL_58_15]OGR10175.1 MAG: hydrogenase [Deltaproteobacteria bacterium RIFOXYB12_FULL_58_9]
MLKELLERFRQGYRTMPYPNDTPAMPDRFRGRPRLPDSLCEASCHACEAICPTGAIISREGKPSLDMGRCLFCADCATACPAAALSFTLEHRLSVWDREDLIIGPTMSAKMSAKLSAKMPAKMSATRKKPVDPRLRLIRRSLKLRQVSAGGCNACEADINVLGTLAFDLGRFGIQVVASPRHADGLLVTGPVTENMKHALEKTYQAVPPPRLVIAVGACAVSGGPYRDHSETHNGVSEVLPVDLWIPGCPPHPLTILDGLLKLTRGRNYTPS